MCHGAGRGQRITDEQPAGARLHRDLDPPASEPRRPPRHGRRRRIDPTAHHLARVGIQRVEGDLRSMHIKPGYNRHQGLLRVPAIAYRANHLAPRKGARVHAIFAANGAAPRLLSGSTLCDGPRERAPVAVASQKRCK
jgi:hypothetical protein